MKTLIRHLIENNMDEIVSKSLLHCHCKDVHSIMLLESPGKTIRLFVALPGNELWKNSVKSFSDNVPMSVGFHAHHCNATLKIVKGQLTNWIVERSDNYGFEVDKFVYQSAISIGGAAKFELCGKSVLITRKEQTMARGHYSVMQAKDIHTVSTHKNQVTAWYVFEGKEDVDYFPVTYSNTDLSRQDFSKLYQKPTKDEVLHLLSLSGLV